MTPLIVIVGLQKSGTTLLQRFLQQSGCFRHPFDGEGDDFWGNTPPFSPDGHPVGLVYQAHRGDRGHEIGADEWTPEATRVLQARLTALGDGDVPVVNKNPYHTVRLPWLRQVFPHAVVVAMIRRPVPNVFSLFKKHFPHPGAGLPPEEGWWGVKPAGWRTLVDPDKVVQCARQWQAVNDKLWRDRELIDRVVEYGALCARPRDVVEDVCRLATGRGLPETAVLAPVPDFDREYSRGAGLKSKNRISRQTGCLDLSGLNERIELRPFSRREIAEIREMCGATAGAWRLPK